MMSALAQRRKIITGRKGHALVSLVGRHWIPFFVPRVALPPVSAASMPLLITLLYGLAALFGAAFGLMELRMLTRFLRHRDAIRSGERWRTNGASGDRAELSPTVTIQIPLYNERTSAEQIIRAAAAQNYPRDRFDIQVLDDSTDETSVIVARVAEEARDSGLRIEHLRRDARNGYKAGALAEGLDRSSSEFVAVFDADFAPQTGFLKAILCDADPFADPKVAFVQARWTWGSGEDQNWLARAMALLLDRHFRVQKPVQVYLGNVTTFNGSGGIWRRAAIDDAGGWASDTLTEDLDLSYRCALAGWRGHYLQNVGVLNEVPGHMRALKIQQRRWAKGTAQCLRKLGRRIMSSGDVVEDRWEELFLLAAYAIHPILLASMILWPWAVLYVDRTLFWVLQAFMGLGIVTAALTLLVTIHERDHRLSVGALREMVAGLVIGGGLMVNNTVGQVQGFLTTGGEFVRTPKRAQAPKGETPSGTGADRPYSTPLHWTFFAELLGVAYCVVGAVILIQQGEALWSLALILWGASLGLIVQQQLIPPPA